MKKEKKDKHFIKKPIYPGGLSEMRKFIKSNLQYPKEALAQKIEGVVRLKYTVNQKGKVVDTKVIHHLGHGCDEEAERIVRLMNFEVPKNRNVNVLFHKSINIRFKLPKSQTISYVYTNKKKEENTQEKKQSGGGYNYTITIG